MRKLYISVGKRQYLHANCTAFAILFGLNYLYKAKPVVRWPRIILKHYFGAHSVLIRYVFGSLFLQCVQKGPQLPTWSACGPNCWNGLHFHHTRHPPHNWGIYVCWFCVLVLDIFCQQLGIYLSWRVSVRRAQGWGNMYCVLSRTYICIGYILPTIWEYISVEYTYWYWIYSANNWGYISVGKCLCALRAQGWGIRTPPCWMLHFVVYLKYDWGGTSQKRCYWIRATSGSILWSIRSP